MSSQLSVFLLTSKRSHKRVKKTSCSVFIPADILNSPEIMANAGRNNLSSTVISSLMHDIITEAFGDPTRVNLCHSTAYRYAIVSL